MNPPIKIGRAMMKTIRRGLSAAPRQALMELVARGLAHFVVRPGFIGYEATAAGKEAGL